MAKGKSKSSASSEGLQIVETNKRARREYEISDVYEAGIQLLGSEVKSARSGGVSLKESYIRIKNNEAFLVGAHFSPYAHSSVDSHEPTRDRKLLLHRREIDRLRGQVRQKGLTIVPLRMYFKKGKCKLEMGLGRGRKLYDKREAVKTKQAKRMMERSLRNRER